MDIYNYNTLELVHKYGFRFTKTLGQNFLIDNAVPRDIAEGADVNEEDLVIEIGPGVGTLTAQLLQRAKKVTVIEIDRTLIPILEEELGDNEKLTIINKDALKVDFNEIIGEEKSVKLVANLPYYVTTPIMANLFKSGVKFKNMTVMIQKEVADRMNAEPGTKDYGSISLLVQYYCDTHIVRKVGPNCFMPRPKVDSIVIRLDRLEEPRVKVLDEKLLFDVIRSSFNMRRKTLWNGLKNIGLSKEDLALAFENANIDPKRRGETLSLEEFGALTNEIYKLK
ncbi:16S rRNA (adenine(1518)-N(6)/adenine(1519)-N(6))-dimethyltransferase RsmA [Clostridium chrysemydis]|uniref:16S rRNA (adenine(1518)-N(6)/adenine(1519)-N(6))- dimethyltransferase RsmA n=1 Tax=Clostridium chrysemydis TaxID=2665504 RepID=UPI0018833A66|nr:16S rRNA (adenine(1518)-N(6)/adenine(1519)-N(6))-dimethyltransferase RsmA [Clostridium chrysemydis]